MDNIEELLRALADDDDNGSGGSGEGYENASGMFSGIEPETLLKIFALFETVGQPDDNERFLLALKPLLREENREKVNSAIRLLKLLSLLPILSESGLLGSLL